MGTGTRNLDAEGLGSLRRMTDETADVDLPEGVDPRDTILPTGLMSRVESQMNKIKGTSSKLDDAMKEYENIYKSADDNKTVFGLKDYDTTGMSEIKQRIIQLEEKLGRLNPNAPGFRERAKPLVDEIEALQLQLKNVDLPPPGSRGGPDDIAAPVMNVEDVVTMQGKGGMDFIDFVRRTDPEGAAKLQKEVDRLNAASDAADARFAIANMPDAPSKRATAREFLVEALKEDDTFATKLGSVIDAQDVKYITEGGGGIMGDPLVLVEKYFGPRILEMIPPGASNEEIILFTRRVMNNVEDAAGFKPDDPRFDRFTARFIDEVQDFARGGLAKILEV
jgi:hypothetical protein